MNYKVNKRERFYFLLKVIFTLLILFGVVSGIGNLAALGMVGTMSVATMIAVVFVYAAFIWLFVVFQKIMLVGHIKGNGIEITETQFPAIYKKYSDMVESLGIKKRPRLFIVQEGGLLNAFATRFSGKNYIAIYSEIFSLHEDNEDVVNFVLGHELGHIKQKHLLKRFWTLPSAFIPFLEAAYSRCCEYTCDNIGNALAPEKSIEGLVLLAAGKDVYKKINIDSYINSAKANYTAVVKIAGLFVGHPYLPKRIVNLKKI